MTKRAARPAPLPGSALRLTLWLLLVPAAAPLAAQDLTADSLWAAGEYAAAKEAYELALHDNPGWVRAYYRLAVLASWDGQLDSALALLADARELEPFEESVRAYEARMYTWKGDYPAAVLRYDSVLADNGNLREARFGRAQAYAWWGRHEEAEKEFRALVMYDPRDAEALVALAQLRQWQGRPDEASQYAAQALRVAPGDPAARAVARQARAMSRPRLEVTLGFGHDSDDNNTAWQTLATSFIASDGLRLFASVGAFEASDPIQDGTRVSGEAGASWLYGNLGVTAALGARRLASDFGIDRSLATWRASASYRISPGAGVGLGYGHLSLDETAQLIGRELDLDELSVEADLNLTNSTTLGLGTSAGFLSDDNRRRSAVASLTQRVMAPVTVGFFARVLAYDDKVAGYFSPDRFLVGEGRASWTRVTTRWLTRFSGGLGLQQVGRGAVAQAQWHLEARVARQWATINEVSASASYSNSAVSSTTGAYNYYTLVLGLRLGL